MVRQESLGLHTYNIHFLSTIRSLQYTGYSYSLSCRKDLWNTMPPCSPFSFHNLHPSAVCQTSGSFTRPVMLESWWRPVMLPVTTKETCSKSRKRKRLFVPESFWSYLNLHLYVSFCLVIKSVQYRLAYDNANKINTHFGYTHITLRAIILIIITYYHVVYPSIEMFWMLYYVIFRYGTVLLAPLDPQPDLHSFSAVPQQVDGTNGLAVGLTEKLMPGPNAGEMTVGAILTLGATVPSLKEKAVSSHYAALKKRP